VDEEQFGPTLPILPFRDLGDAVKQGECDPLWARRLDLDERCQSGNGARSQPRMRYGIGQPARDA